MGWTKYGYSNSEQHLATYRDNVWHKWLFNLWVNGVTNSTIQQNVGFANLVKYNQILSIGGGADGTGNYMASKGFYGNIDELYVYDRALNSAEINQVKNDTDGVAPVFSIVSSDALFQNTNAQITNVINPNNVNATVDMYWGDTPNVLNTVALGSISGGTNQTFATNLSGLTPSSTYYYQLAFTSTWRI